MPTKFGKINLKIAKVDFIAIVGAIYLFLSIQPFFMWSLPLVSVFFFIIFSTLLLLLVKDNRLRIKKSVFFIVLLLILYALYMTVPLFGHELLPGKIIIFLPLALLLFLSHEELYGIFKVWKKILIFFSLYALVIYVLFALGIDIPHWKIKNSEYIPATIRDMHYYRVYGFVVSSTNTLVQMGGLVIQRICGPFAEPGHFAIYLGFTIFIDRLRGNKMNIILLITGFLTLSAAFAIILVIIELYRLTIEKRFNLKLYLSILFVILLLGMFKGKEIKEAIIYNIIERHSDLDKRSPKAVRAKFESFMRSSKVFTGLGIKDMQSFGGSLSDPRGMIAKFGLIGLFLSLTIIFLLVFRLEMKYAIFLFAAVMMVYMHRVWMFENTSIYTFIILANSSIRLRCLT